MLRNEFTETYRSSGAPVLPPIVQLVARDDARFFPRYAGQGVGLADGVPPAAEVVRSTIREAAEALEALSRAP